MLFYQIFSTQKKELLANSLVVSQLVVDGKLHFFALIYYILWTTTLPFLQYTF